MRRGQYIYEFAMGSLKEKEIQLRTLIRRNQEVYDYALTKLNVLESDFAKDNHDLANIIRLIRNSEFGIKKTYELEFTCSKHKLMLIHRYLVMFIQAFNRLNNLNHKLRYHHLFYTNESLFKDVIYTYNYNMVKEVLMGAKLRLGSKMGNIYILKKKRTFYLDDQTTVTRSINWNESLKYKQLLIEQGITPYNKATAPNGVKWFIYYNEEYTYWYKWHNNRFNKFLTGTIFSPLAYVTIPKEERHKLEQSFKSVKEILDCPVFGPIEKLQVIKRQFPNHMLIFDTYEL